MAIVHFTQALKRFYPQLKPLELEAQTVQDVLKVVEQHYPGINSYLLDDQGRLRKHVNIFVDGSLIKDRETLQDTLGPQGEVYIMQALSGG
ncbi:MAG: MoaD/ThiS family protein [Bacteroidota bacterium]